MLLGTKLKREALIQYSHTDNAHQAFRNAVTNGQARLAMDILVEVIDGLVDKVHELEEKLSGEPSVITPASVTITEEVATEENAAIIKPKKTPAAKVKEEVKEEEPAEA